MTTLDRNIVIEASAGTGKTYALVQMVLRALFEKGLPMESIVALTFTKKAAGEMKERIAAALQGMIKEEKDAERARQALASIDRAAISTIHSYAYSLLKRFPLAAGISADAEVDEKDVKGDELFDEEWPRWLSIELNENTPRREAWLEVLSKTDLSDVRHLARRLADFDVPLDRLPLADENQPKALAPYLKKIRELLVGKPDQKATKIAVACEEILVTACAGEPLPENAVPILDEKPAETKAWLPDEVDQLQFLQNIARNVAAGGDRLVRLLTELLLPFIARLRARLLAEGILSNNALLSLARELVATNTRVRETLKREIRLILVDEFQDTDPLQGELILFLAEKPGRQAKRWQNTELEPGKLFLVGDPKQSIYRFRGADIAAYRAITDQVLAQGGISEPLSRSWRSHDGIVHAVNAAFSHLIEEKTPISPPYQALEPRRKRDAPERQYVEMRLAAPADKQSSEDAIQREADDAAAWIKDNVGNHLSYKDIALVFRSTPTMPPFIEALRRHNIPYVVEGERYFYGTTEVTDVLNLLRVIARPGDRLALAGFLRSPLGGFSDPELALLQQINGLRLDHPLPSELDSPAHHGAWQLLRDLARRVEREPLKAVLRHVYEDTFLLELAARSYHRDQTVANLYKLKRLMESFAEEGVSSLEVLLGKIDRWREDDRLEGESPLADEWYDAVRLLTIHKAKGLEFPAVWLPGLHKGRTRHDPDPDAVRVLYDWSTGRLGIRVGRKGRNLGHFILEREADEREDAEERRVLYVAMTRAREILVLSGGTNLQRPAKDSPLSLLAGAWDVDVNHLPPGDAEIGEASLRIHHFSPETAEKKEPLAEETPLSFDPVKIAARWKQQEKARRQAEETILVTTPTSITVGAGFHPRPQSEPDESESMKSGSHYTDFKFDSSDSDFGQAQRPAPTLLGTLLHRFLEHWDFAGEKCSMPAQLTQIAKAFFAQQGLPYDEALMLEARRILADFIGSEAWEEIKGAEILGREVPFFYMTEGGREKGEGSNVTPHPSPITPRTLMRGTLDILYRLPTGQVVIGDYKTGKTAHDYSVQGKTYEEAVHRALGINAVFKVINLREEATIS